MDRNTEAQVWQRVRTPQDTQSQGLGLPQLAGQAAEELALFQALTARQPREKARYLLEPLQENLACLRGLCALSGQAAPKRTPAVPHPDPRRCFAMARQAAGEYTARSIDPEFGLVFQDLARREQVVCARLAQILGGT